MLTPVGLLINVSGLIWLVDPNKRRSVQYFNNDVCNCKAAYSLCRFNSKWRVHHRPANLFRYNLFKKSFATFAPLLYRERVILNYATNIISQPLFALTERNRFISLENLWSPFKNSLFIASEKGYGITVVGISLKQSIILCLFFCFTVNSCLFIFYFCIFFHGQVRVGHSFAYVAHTVYDF